MVYVDKLFDCTAFNPPACFKGRSCHMWADTLGELMDMAKSIGLKPSWLQHGSRGDFPHFDLTKRRREAAVLAGAQEANLRDHLRKRLTERIAAFERDGR